MGLLPKRKRIAVVELHGTIGGSIKSPVYERIFSSIRKDRTTRALVLDIDSPGGGVPASDLLYRSVSKIAEEKQVVASIRGIGASGAYMMACAAHKIVANPGSLVGSIGVISIRPVLQELLGRLGVGVNVNKSGNLKDMGAFWRDATPEETRKMQALIDDSFDVFVDVVAKARRMEEARVREVATGEVYWAPKAQELGLVDELGDLDRAIDLAAEELSGAPRRPVYVRRRRGHQGAHLRAAGRDDGGVGRGASRAQTVDGVFKVLGRLGSAHLTLHLLPQGLLLVQGEFREREVSLTAEALHGGEPAVEAVVGLAKSALGVYAQPACGVHQRKQQVAQLRLPFRRGLRRRKLVQLLRDLVEDTLDILPVEAGAGRAPLDGLCVGQRGHLPGYAVEDGGLGTRGLKPLDGVPIGLHVPGVRDFFVSEDVRMAPNKFFDQRPENLFLGQLALFCSNLRLKDDVEEDVAQLLDHLVRVALLDGLDQLVALLQELPFDRLVCLLPVPGTSVRAAEPLYQL